jgi:anti-anti-sigma regulatory factor
MLSHALIVANRQELKLKVIDAIDAGKPTVILDASECGYIDASGMGVLWCRSRRSAARKAAR